MQTGWRKFRWRWIWFSCFLSLGLSLFGQEPQLPTTDAEITALISSTGESQAYPGANRVVVLDATITDVEASGLCHIRQQQIEKLLTDDAAAAYTRLRFDYDPASNMIDIQKVRIFRKNGQIETLAAATFLDLPQPQWGIIWGARMKIVPLPRLGAGDAIEYQWYKKGFMIAYLQEEDADARYIPPMRGHFYDTVIFESNLPIYLKYYQVNTIRNSPMQYEVYHGAVGSRVHFTEQQNLYKFWKARIPAFKSEPAAPGLSDLATKVVMTTVPDWPGKSRWFYVVNDQPWQVNPSIQESVFDWDAAIKQKVTEITRQARTDSEKVAAIVYWVAQEIRYFGITMGAGEGYTLHPGKMIFNDRCGVCKDKAGMAITMLRAAGFEAYPAMTMAGARVERVPADQFNHCVAAWKKKDGRYQMLDPTWVPFSMELWSSAESEQHYVIGTPAGAELMRTPLSPAENHTLEFQVASELKSNGDLAGTLTICGQNYSDQRLRRALVQAYRNYSRPVLIEQWLAELAPQARLTEFNLDYAQIFDLTKPLKLTIKFEIPKYAVKFGNRLRVVPVLARPMVTSGGFNPYLNAATLENRQQPLDLWCPRAFKYQETMALPAKFTISQKTDDLNITNEVGSLQTKLALENNKLVYQNTWKILPRNIEVEKYPQFKKIVASVLNLRNQAVWLTSK